MRVDAFYTYDPALAGFPAGPRPPIRAGLKEQGVVVQRPAKNMEGETMAIVMVSTGALTHSGVRTVSLQSLLLGTGIAALILVAAGIAIGYFVARSGTSIPLPLHRAPAQAPYTIEQLGALAGRLFRLENEAAQLGKRVGLAPNHDAQSHDSGSSSGKTGTGGSGGPMLPPRLPSSDPVAALDEGIKKVEAQLARVGSLSTQRNLSQMFFPSRLPISGVELGSAFGNRVDPITHRLAFHGGLDFAADPGTPIRAAAGGVVAFAGWSHDFGWLVEIDHGNGLVTRYAHASKLVVKTGMLVAPGDVLSYVGSTGRSTGPHLHFEVLRNGQYDDPQNYLAGL